MRKSSTASLYAEVELLENRVFLTHILWTNTDGGQYGDPQNWSPSQVPDGDYEVQITNDVLGPIVFLNLLNAPISPTINSLLATGTASLDLRAQEFTMSQLDVEGGTADPPEWPKLTVSGGLLRVQQTTIVGADSAAELEINFPPPITSASKLLMLGTGGVENSGVQKIAPDVFGPVD